MPKSYGPQSRSLRSARPRVPKHYCFDLETDGLLPELTKVHSLVIRDATSGDLIGSYADHPGYPPILEGLEKLAEGDLLIGHNVVTFDLLALAKVYGISFDPAKIRDTLILARVLWPEVKVGDFMRVKKGLMPSSLLNRPHSLAAWGYRLGVMKGDFGKSTDWKTWSAEMQTYCEQDTTVTVALWRRIVKKDLDPRCIELEHAVAALCARITANGFPFDVVKARELLAEVQARKEIVGNELRDIFPPIKREKLFVPKVNNTKLGYKKGVPFTKVKMETFNPGSLQQIAERLQLKGWKPAADGYSEKGQITIDETVLESLGQDYPEAPLLIEHLFLTKREAALIGKQGWLVLERAGKIHGEYLTSGAVTGRATHSKPNIAQVPSVEIDKDTKLVIKGPAGGYGWNCRSMFGVPKGWTQVGADMSGLELRCLSHYMAPFDDGFYAETVVNGDIHTVNMLAADIPTRAIAKTFIYAFLYGAGAWKIGHTVNPKATDEEKIAIGNSLKNKFLKNTKGLKQLRTAVGTAVEKHGDLQGLDGRPLTVRKKHAALNTLLQSAGAILCKRWIISVERTLLSLGLSHGWGGDFAMLAWVHDEIQIACRTPEIAEVVARVCVEETSKAGEYFGFRCALSGEAKKGTTWAACH